jgi:hypothetical protein
MILSAESVFLVFFTFDAILKVIVMGLWRHIHSYLRQGLNVVDILIIIAG